MNKSEDSKKFVSYVRKAAVSQTDNELEISQRSLRKVAETASLHLVAEIAEHLPAYQPRTRPGFNRLITLISTGRANGILCERLAVLTRNPVELAMLARLMEEGQLKEILTPGGAITKETLAGVWPGWLAAFEANFRKALKERGLPQRRKLLDKEPSISSLA